jgi:hypothetical protein
MVQHPPPAWTAVRVDKACFLHTMPLTCGKVASNRQLVHVWMISNVGSEYCVLVESERLVVDRTARAVPKTARGVTKSSRRVTVDCAVE